MNNKEISTTNTLRSLRIQLKLISIVHLLEDFDYGEYQNYFDVVFTSPPYFSVERYSHDDTQSWVRYKNIDVWNEHFLHKALGKIIPTVKKGGIAVNIADVYTNSSWSTDRQWLEITNPMGDFLTSQGLTYKGCIGMEMGKKTE